MLKKKLYTPLYVGEKISNSREVWGKNSSQTKLVKSPIPDSPTNVHWSCQTFRGWGKKRIWHLSKCHPLTKWPERVLHVVVFKTKVLHFKIENTQMERESSKECSVSFCGQKKAFRYEIVFRGIQPWFLHGGSERLACFEPTKAALFLKTLEVHSVLNDQRKARF